MGTALIQEILGMLGEGVSTLGTNIATGVGDTAKALFVVETTTSSGTTYNLSVFGTIIVVFAGVAIAIGLTKLVMHFVMSLGGKSY